MAAKDMLGTVVRKLVTLPLEALGVVCDLLEKMADPEWVEATKKFLRKENPWSVIQKVVSDLLKFIKEVKLPAIGSFSVKDHYRVGVTDNVKIGYVSENFQQEFGDKVEDEVAEATLKIHQLKKASVDNSIIAELGGEEVAETTLGQMWEMLKKQGHGQNGDILTNGHANISYIRNAKGVLWTVYCHWDFGYGPWYVYALLVTAPGGWVVGRQVVSR